jgi:hypothetical protein
VKCGTGIDLSGNSVDVWDGDGALAVPDHPGLAFLVSGKRQLVSRDSRIPDYQTLGGGMGHPAFTQSVSDARQKGSTRSVWGD